MGASVFHGAVIRSPFPVWQWQSMIMGETPFRLGGAAIRLQPLPGRGQKPDACGNSGEEVSQAELLVRRVNPVVGKRESHQDGGDAENFLERVHHRNGAARSGENGWGA